MLIIPGLKYTLYVASYTLNNDVSRYGDTFNMMHLLEPVSSHHPHLVATYFLLLKVKYSHGYLL